jgi:uncharacterized metal-binding protein
MPELPKKKVGIVACSGEDLAEGLVTRLAALKVLEQLRPADTVTICLPLYLAGGEGDRAFARFYPTIAVDGCDLRCAARATEMYSGKTASSLVVSDLVAEQGLAKPQGRHRLDDAGMQVVEATAELVALEVDSLLEMTWSRRAGRPVEVPVVEVGEESGEEATCICASDVPTHAVMLGDREVQLAALPLIFDQFRERQASSWSRIGEELLEAVRIYNSIPEGEEEIYVEALLRSYFDYCKEVRRRK